VKNKNKKQKQKNKNTQTHLPLVVQIFERVYNYLRQELLF
jgi:hypothetical protein